MSQSCRRLRASPRDKNSPNDTHSDAHREPSNDEPSNDEPSNDEPSNDEPSNDEPSNDEPSNDEPSNDEPSKWRGDDVAGWVLRLWKSRFLM
jgi:hypothetical protein